MGQNKLKDYQKQLFEYDYTLKKIDNILISTRLPQEEREHYQLSREACQKAKNKTSQEMADHARQNRLSLLIAPLSKDEKEELIRSMERGTGETTETIRFDDVRGEGFYIEEEPFIPEVTAYKTKKLNEFVVNAVAEVEDNGDLELEELKNKELEIENLGIKELESSNLEDENLDNGDVENENLDIENLDNEGLYNENLENEDVENDTPVENDFDFVNEKDFSDAPGNDSDPLSYSHEVIDFIKSLKNELSLFYGIQ